MHNKCIRNKNLFANFDIESKQNGISNFVDFLMPNPSCRRAVVALFKQKLEEG